MAVAARAGVSSSAVSRAMRGLPISAAAHQAATEAATELAYAPDQIGRGLRRGRSGSIAYCAPDMSVEDTSALIAGCSSRVQRAGGCLVVTCAEATIPHLARTRRIDGVIFAPGRTRGRECPVLVSDLGEYRGDSGSIKHCIRWDYARSVSALLEDVGRSGFDGVITVEHHLDDAGFIEQIVRALPGDATHVRWTSQNDLGRYPAGGASKQLAVILSGRGAVKAAGDVWAVECVVPPRILRRRSGLKSATRCGAVDRRTHRMRPIPHGPSCRKRRDHRLRRCSLFTIGVLVWSRCGDHAPTVVGYGEARAGRSRRNIVAVSSAGIRP